MDASLKYFLDSSCKPSQSRPPTGGVTFRAFKTLAPITALMGDRDSDLSFAELKECWENGCLGADRVDRGGFLRVWREIGELFEGDIMDEGDKLCMQMCGRLQ